MHRSVALYVAFSPASSCSSRSSGSCSQTTLSASSPAGTGVVRRNSRVRIRVDRVFSSRSVISDLLAETALPLRSASCEPDAVTPLTL